MQRKTPENIILNTSSSAQRTRGGGRSTSMRILTQISSGSLRRAAGGGPHNISCPANYCGGSSGSYMNTNQQRPIDYYEFRGAHMPPPPQSTPMPSFNLPTRQETFGSQIDYNLNWMPKDVELNNPVDTSFLMAAHAQHKNQTGKYFTKEAKFPGPSSFERNDSTPRSDNSRYLLRQQALRDSEIVDGQKRSPKKESLLEWFDRTVEAELQRRRDASLNVGENMINLDPPLFSPFDKNRTKRSNNALLTEASTSGLDINASLREEKDTELLIAVDKLAKAEAMCTFEGAVRAAEAAAASAPPEYVEEAAAAGAHSFEAKLTGVVKQQIDGVKPVEVVGYVGITRPNKPKKSE
ncbi:hypothetical protein RN001_002829 [Aquatica leii]|uniref:Uncharacterized protein n=1 Tax=Aquatica leii TaxID=1421715 RepID=A0AAN7SRD7_9COLE|nr:hypothetical protein RN001_002829 [Aquatica leii]